MKVQKYISVHGCCLSFHPDAWILKNPIENLAKNWQMLPLQFYIWSSCHGWQLLQLFILSHCYEWSQWGFVCSLISFLHWLIYFSYAANIWFKESTKHRFTFISSMFQLVNMSNNLIYTMNKMRSVLKMLMCIDQLRRSPLNQDTI